MANRQTLSANIRAVLGTGMVWLSALLMAGFFLLFVGDIFRLGAGRVSWEFLTTAPQQAGRAGGIFPILVSTLAILVICLTAAVPAGVASAMFLSEFATQYPRLGRGVRRSLEVLAGVPSVVFGLFGNAFFCQTLGFGVSLLSGGLTLALMILPFLIRAAEEGFRSIDPAHRLAASALGFSQTSMMFRVLLPLAAPGILAGVVLGIGRALAETAALFFTSGYVPRMPQSPWDSGRMLSVHIYDLAMNISGGNEAAYAAACVLAGLLLLINFTAQTVLSRVLQSQFSTGKTR